jgi:Ca2+-transporting ATPase
MSLEGLKNGQVAKLREKYGENFIPEKSDFSVWKLFFSQFKNPLIYILLLAVVISAIFGDIGEIMLIVFVILINVLMGFYQEYSANKTLEALKKILKPQALVIRGGKRKIIDIRELVPGDLVVLGAGDKVPADGVYFDGTNLLVDEAILTGESAAIEKETIPKKDLDSLNLENQFKDLDFEKLDLKKFNDKNKVFMGSTVMSGLGQMIVLKTGLETLMGHIGRDLSKLNLRQKTPLQIRFESFTKKLSYIIVLIAIVVFIIEIFTNGQIFTSLQIAIILAVATIPEALPVAVTILMSIGMKRILKRKGLVKKLMSIETLGSTSVICTDKTGTLTQGKLKVEVGVFTQKALALKSLVLTNDKRSSLEYAVIRYIENEQGLDSKKIAEKYKRIYEEPFNSAKKYSLSINQFSNHKRGFISGAPEIVLDFCKLSDKEKTEILKKIDKYAKKGLKIMGTAYKKGGDLKKTKNYQWLGFVGFKDPIRQGVIQSIKQTKKAGIKVKIVTGDYLETAKKVALELGFKVSDKNVLTGEDFEKLSQKELEKKIEEIIIFARVTPHQKLKIVQVLQDKKEIVAMTGDGVNDALALKKADIGVAMDNASEVSKQASDLVLLDGDFTTIMKAAQEGRLIFANIRKLTGYVLSDSFIEVLLVLGAVLFRLPLPLTMLQILWIQFICDGPLDIALGFEKKDKNLMQKKPLEIKERTILGVKMRILVSMIAIICALFAFILFAKYYSLTGDEKLARTMAFVSVSFFTIIFVFSFKNPNGFVWKNKKIYDNKYLFYMALLGMFFLVISLYVPFLSNLLKVTPIGFNQWLVVIILGFVAFLIVELVKEFFLKNLKTKS